MEPTIATNKFLIQVMIEKYKLRKWCRDQWYRKEVPKKELKRIREGPKGLGIEEKISVNINMTLALRYYFLQCLVGPLKLQ